MAGDELDSGTFTDTDPVYQDSQSKFRDAIQSLVGAVNEKAAHIETLLRHSPGDMNERKYRILVFGNFYSFLWQLVENSRSEIRNKHLKNEMDAWLSSYVYDSKQKRVALTTGINLSRRWQEELKEVGIIDLNKDIYTTFPFALYLSFVRSTGNYDSCEGLGISDMFETGKGGQDPNLDYPGGIADMLPDEIDVYRPGEDGPAPKHPEGENNQGQNYPKATNEVIGFGGNGAFAAMHGRYFSDMSMLMSKRQYKHAREYFYQYLGDVAVLFDLPFLDNCIDIESQVFGKHTETADRTYRDSMTVFQLHRAELSALMSRAHIFPKPDVRQIINSPFQVPQSIKEVIPKPVGAK